MATPDKANRPQADKGRDRKHTSTTGNTGKPSTFRKLNLLTATADDIMKVTNQVARERADTITRYVEFHLAGVADGSQQEYANVSEFLRDIPGFGPKLSRAFEAFTELDYSETAERDEEIAENRAEAEREEAKS